MANYFGYMRISTKEERGKQKFTRQEKALETFAKENKIEYTILFRDDVSGKSFERDEWKKLEKIVQPGDTIVFKDITRFTREAENGYKKYMELYNRGIELVFLDNPTLNTSYTMLLTNTAKDMNFLEKTVHEMLVKVMLAAELTRAEQERLQISKRIKDGIEASEKKSGRIEGKVDKLTDELRADLVRYMTRDLTGTEVMNKHNISRNTLKKYAAMVKAEM